MQAVKLTKDHPELQLPQWKTFNPDKLIHLRGTLEKRGLSQALTRKGGGNVIFPSLQFLGTRVKHSGTPPLAAESTNGVLVKLTKWVKGENSYQSPLRSLLCCPMEKKVRFLHVVPSFPNADGLAKTFVRIRALNCDSCLSYQVPTGGDPFSQGQLCLLLYGGPENLAQQHSVWWPPNMARLKDELCPIFSQIWMDSWGPTDCCQLSGELLESFPCPSLRVNSRSWEGNFYCTLLADACYSQELIQCYQGYLLFVLAEIWQDIWNDFFIFYWSSSMDGPRNYHTKLSQTNIILDH